MSGGEFLAPDDPRWDEALGEMVHDAYHLPAYVRFSAQHEGGTPAAYLGRHGRAALLLPLLERPLPPEWGEPGAADAASPYGYPAPIFTPGTSPAEARALLAQFAGAARARGLVAAFVRGHPLFPLDAQALPPEGAEHVHGQTVHVPLEAPLESVRAGYRHGHAYEIRRLLRLGFSVCWDRWELLGEFERTYRETMERVAASDFYLLGHGYFAGLRDALGPRLHLGTVHDPHGEVAAAGLFSRVDGIAQYLFSGTAAPFMKLAPTKLLLDDAVRLVREQGARVLHLGGGLGAGEDSLFRFKAGFSPARAEYRTLRWIFDRDRYDRLSAGVPGAPADGPESGFFPAYRAPAPVSVPE